MQQAEQHFSQMLEQWPELAKKNPALGRVSWGWTD
jgi:hypothetical protein